MKKLICFGLFHLMVIAAFAIEPVSYKGRFRPADAYANQWLFEFYHKDALKKEHLQAFHAKTPSALDFLWHLHFLGHTPFDEAPLFWIQQAEIKKLLDLDLEKNHFSFLTLFGAVSAQAIPQANKSLVQESQTLQAALANFEGLKGAELPLEHSLENALRTYQLQRLSPKEISLALEQQFPLRTRLQQAGQILKILPGKISQGEWYSLHALHAKVFNPATQQLELAGNFTLYPEDLFHRIRQSYFAWEGSIAQGNPIYSPEAQQLFQLLEEGYSASAGKPYKSAAGKQLLYPTVGQLRAESFYARQPLVMLCIVLYLIALLFCTLAWSLENSGLSAAGLVLVIIAFLFHTFILALRIYILGRPPVSNMFETILYVPWAAVLTSLLLRLKFRNPALLISSALLSVVLLALLSITHLDSAMENVQAVLDSQYWLIIHVLMVVGSYGVFLLCGILGHIYLAGRAIYKVETQGLQFLAQIILQTMYIGVSLLVPGTILGGVWAAESWGRFWDWDPKESWAFISICVYLLWIHAYRFHKIGHIGLAVGAVTGIIAISFTWYGVNYILGTGLHSYGFGNGGEWWYYSYVLAEILFLGCISALIGRKNQKIG